MRVRGGGVQLRELRVPMLRVWVHLVRVCVVCVVCVVQRHLGVLMLVVLVRVLLMVLVLLVLVRCSVRCVCVARVGM